MLLREEKAVLYEGPKIWKVMINKKSICKEVSKDSSSYGLYFFSLF